MIHLDNNDFADRRDLELQVQHGRVVGVKLDVGHLQRRESVTLRGFVFPQAWRYRDYVIDAFNRDLPYNRFVQEQIAGDLLPAEDWLVRIVNQFRARDIVFVFGKVLPRWEVAPPPEMLTTSARDIWGPLALIDYGDELATYDAASFGDKRLPIGANLAIRRDAVERVGGWRTDLGKIDNTLIAGEDHELCVRLYSAGLYSGLYDPDVMVRHFVPASRLTRTYFRRWFYWHGKTMARMTAAIYLDLDLARVRYVAGVPRFVYREFLEQTSRWLRRAGRTDALALLVEEVKLVEYLGFFAESWLRRTPSAPAGHEPHGDVALGQSIEA